MVGLMSGSSLDGIDLAYTTFEFETPIIWKLQKYTAVDLPDPWPLKLANLPKQPVSEFANTNAEYGFFLGDIILRFAKEINQHIDAVAVHGHTVYHSPDHKTSIQFGSPAHIANVCMLPVISDFRSADMAFGGQGAPLAHMADEDLFPGYDWYLNIGGIANLSISHDGHIVSSFDVCGANQVLNRLAEPHGMPYDNEGLIARRGSVFTPLLSKLLDHPFLKTDPPRSLDNQYTVQEFYEPFSRINLSTEDKLATATEWIAQSIVNATNVSQSGLAGGSMLITGGGAFNTFLLERIQTLSEGKIKIDLPAEEIINYKEALLMGYLGALRLRHEPNCKKRVTGASRDSINGQVYWPSSNA